MKTICVKETAPAKELTANQARNPDFTTEFSSWNTDCRSFSFFDIERVLGSYVHWNTREGNTATRVSLLSGSTAQGFAPPPFHFLLYTTGEKLMFEQTVDNGAVCLCPELSKIFHSGVASAHGSTTRGPDQDSTVDLTLDTKDSMKKFPTWSSSMNCVCSPVLMTATFFMFPAMAGMIVCDWTNFNLVGVITKLDQSIQMTNVHCSASPSPDTGSSLIWMLGPNAGLSMHCIQMIHCPKIRFVLKFTFSSNEKPSNARG